MSNPILLALFAGTFTWFITALGAATVVFFKKVNQKTLNLMLGFSAGVMIAASFWSLLEPAIEQASVLFPFPPCFLVCAGFVCGTIFIWLCDTLISKAEFSFFKTNKNLKRITMLILSITLHNIPEGLAVGVAFGMLKAGEITPVSLLAPFSIAFSIALQNFPEGAAVSLPLRREGFSLKKCFLLGQASALVEPISAVLGAALTLISKTALPFLLSFAAGTMILVAVHELIPESQQQKQNSPYFVTFGIIGGFTVMMLLDVLLG